MNTEFFNALDILEKEKGIPKEYMLEKVEAALVAAFKRDNNGNSNVRVVMDPVKKDVKVYSVKNIVEEVMDPETEISLEAAKALNRRHVLGGVVDGEAAVKILKNCMESPDSIKPVTPYMHHYVLEAMFKAVDMICDKQAKQFVFTIRKTD